MVTSYSSRGAAPGAVFPLRPVGAGALVGPDGGQVQDMMAEVPDHAHPDVTAHLQSLDSRVAALEGGEAGEIT
jgi:hypothetical protein